MVVAPEEHPFPIGLRSKREARCVAEPTRRHATPLTEALHVPLHLERWCCVANGRPVQIDVGAGQAPLLPSLTARGLSLQRFGVGEHSGSGRERAERVLVKIRELLAAVPSSSASLSVILQSLFLRIFPAQGRIDRQSGQECTWTGVRRWLCAGSASSGPVRRLRTGLADLVNEWLIGRAAKDCILNLAALGPSRSARKGGSLHDLVLGNP